MELPSLDIRPCAKFEVGQRVAIKLRGADPNIGIVADVIHPQIAPEFPPASVSRHQFAPELPFPREKENGVSYRVVFSRPFSSNESDLGAPIVDYVRMKMQESSFLRKILPPNPVAASAPVSHLRNEVPAVFLAYFSESDLEVPVIDQVIERYRDKIEA